MRPSGPMLALVFAAAVALYLPTVRYGFVQDDRAIVAANPAVHAISAAVRAFDDPYWPRASGEGGGLYRPLTILSFAVDWSLSGGSTGWMHAMNALWHGVVAVLAVLLVARWLPEPGAVIAGLIFALHPVHVEGVASLVSRAELLAAAGIFGAVLLARRRFWAGAVACAVLAMFSKEHGVITGAVILLDDWLQSDGRRLRYPPGLYAVLGLATLGFLALWWSVGRGVVQYVAPSFIGAGTGERLALALPATLRAATVLLWPLDLSADYNPQVIQAHAGPSLAALGGALVVVAVVGLWWRTRRRAPAVAVAAGAAALAYLPTSNLLFASGVVLAERALYVPVLLVAVGVAHGAGWVAARRGWRTAITLVAIVCLALGARSLDRLPAWRDNRTFLVTLIEEHPEAYRPHASAAAVFAGLGDTAAARREYARAAALFPGDPQTDAAHALFLLGLEDTAGAAPLVERARRLEPYHRLALRGQFRLRLERGDRPGAVAVRDSALSRYPGEIGWYRQYLP